MTVLSYIGTMAFLSIVWMISWEFMRQENKQLREKNQKLRGTVTFLYGELDRYRPRRSVSGKISSMKDWMQQ